MPEAKTEGNFVLQNLPYPENALEPLISRQTLSLHHGKHHAAYVAKLNELIKGTSYAGQSLEAVIVRSAKDAQHKPIFNNAAQIWNHDFYWRSMRPLEGGAAGIRTPGGALAQAMARDFGSVDEALKRFKTAAVEHFGSGWVWLVADRSGKLQIVPGHDADNPIAQGTLPLLGIDVWEHAYYVDYQNRRPDYVAVWLEKLADWRFAEQNLRAVKAA